MLTCWETNSPSFFMANDTAAAPTILVCEVKQESVVCDMAKMKGICMNGEYSDI